MYDEEPSTKHYGKDIVRVSFFFKIPIKWCRIINDNYYFEFPSDLHNFSGLVNDFIGLGYFNKLDIEAWLKSQGMKCPEDDITLFNLVWM